MDNDKTNRLIMIRNKIEELNKESHIEVFKIFKKHEVDYSENKNGIFINLSITHDKVINDVENYIKYINNQEKIIDEVEHQKQSIEQAYFN